MTGQLCCLLSYRSAGVLAGRPIESADDALAYAAYRLPGTYAAVRACFSEIQRLKPEWVPRTLLDLGGGPGTVAWAATAVWPGLQQLTIIERSSAMIDLGRRLGEHASSEPVRAANWIRGDVRTVAGIAPAELVTAAYRAWRACAGRSTVNSFAMVGQYRKHAGGNRAGHPQGIRTGAEDSRASSSTRCSHRGPVSAR